MTNTPLFSFRCRYEHINVTSIVCWYQNRKKRNAFPFANIYKTIHLSHHTSVWWVSRPPHTHLFCPRWPWPRHTLVAAIHRIHYRSQAGYKRVHHQLRWLWNKVFCKPGCNQFTSLYQISPSSSSRTSFTAFHEAPFSEAQMLIIIICARVANLEQLCNSLCEPRGGPWNSATSETDLREERNLLGTNRLSSGKRWPA